MLVDSKHQKLDIPEIAAIGAAESGEGLSPEQALAAVIAEVHQAGAMAVREGNTLFLVHRAPDNPEIGVFRMINADTHQNCFKNAMDFVKLARTSFDTLVSEFTDPFLVDVFEHIENYAPFPDMSCDVIEQDDDKQLGIINFKPNKV